MSNSERRKKERISRSLVYTAYIAPFVSSLLTILLAFIPCITYTIEGEVRQTISLFTLTKNAFETVRTYLFSSKTNHTADNDIFSKYVFAFVIVAAILLFLAVAVDFYTMTAALSAFSEKRDTSRSVKHRRVFLSVIPNRIIYYIGGFFILPFFLLPEFLILMYRRFLLASVTVFYDLGPLYIYAVVLWLIPVVFSIIARKYEYSCGMVLFVKKKNPHVITENDEETDE